MLPLWQIRFYESSNGKTPIEDFLNKLHLPDREKMLRTIGLLEQFGPNLKMPHCRFIVGENGLWELRSQLGNNIQRVLYFYFKNNTVVLLHGFTKKTQKTPSQEIKTALLRKTEYISRMEAS